MWKVRGGPNQEETPKVPIHPGGARDEMENSALNSPPQQVEVTGPVTTNNKWQNKTRPQPSTTRAAHPSIKPSGPALPPSAASPTRQAGPGQTTHSRGGFSGGNVCTHPSSQPQDPLQDSALSGGYESHCSPNALKPPRVSLGEGTCNNMTKKSWFWIYFLARIQLVK